MTIISNSLIYIQTPYLAFGHTLGYPIVSGQLSNPLIFNQAAYLQSAYNLSAEDIGMHIGGYLSRRKSSMQNPVSESRTLSVTDSYSQMTLCINDIYAQTLRNSFSDVQKEKDSTANATLWRNPNLVYVINQSVNRKANVLYFELQSLKRLPDNIGLVSYRSTNCPS
ncbi:hypothetical protein ID853_11030 [Xenorhabdus sp. Vera]|nr:hypothetical protein [Xenorhabdus sp. Vera]